MSAFNPGMAGLRLRLALARFGLINCIVSVLCLVAALAWLWWMPHLRAQLSTQQHAVKEARRMLNASAPGAVGAAIVKLPAAEQHMADFYDALGEQDYSEQQIKAVLSIAEKTGINLNQAEYKSAFDKNGRYRTYQILLPVKGSYAQIRQFCEKTLMAIPFASLDDMSFKRDAIGNTMLEAQLRFTLYLADEASDVRSISGGVER